jgi:hypothetical protein
VVDRYVEGADVDDVVDADVEGADVDAVDVGGSVVSGAG